MPLSLEFVVEYVASYLLLHSYEIFRDFFGSV